MQLRLPQAWCHSWQCIRKCPWPPVQDATGLHLSYLDASLQICDLSLQAGNVLLICRAEPGGALQERGAAGACPNPTASSEPATGSFTGSYHLPGMISHLL